MKIAIGSTNPAKIRAVGIVTERVWPGAKVVAVAVPTGVSAMPMSDAECLLGARTRARAALAEASAELGIGLEGGVNLEPSGLMLVGWAAIVDSQGRESVGGGARLRLPDRIADRVSSGEELGPVIDQLMGQSNVKLRGGAVGVLTAGYVSRSEAFAMAVYYALAPFLSPQLYQE